MPNIHFIGIGGAGLSAIALVLLEQGYAVTGSDVELSPFAQQLQARGATVYVGHAAEQVGAAEQVIISSAIAPDNVEVQAARAKGVPVLKRADFLGQLMADRLGIAVAGAHGKTTTTGLIAFMLDRAGLAPTFIVGGVLADYGVNARAGQGQPFVIEADEYDRMFLGLKPTVAVVTNVEHDHPDCYPTLADLQTAFGQFVALLPDTGLLVACAQDAFALTLAQARRQAGHPVATYGLTSAADWQAENLQMNSAGGFDFLVARQGRSLGLARTRLAGEHNVLNALAALAVADWLGVDFNTARNALAEYRGVGRRFEVKGEARGVIVVDDYAHHPTEISATLAAARRRFGAERALWVVFQPHTYSRTRLLLDEFAASFGEADHVVVVDIFRSRELPDPTLSAADVVARMARTQDAHYIPDLIAAAQWLCEHLRPGDVVITLSAGDGHRVGQYILENFGKRR